MKIICPGCINEIDLMKPQIHKTLYYNLLQSHCVSCNFKSQFSLAKQSNEPVFFHFLYSGQGSNVCRLICDFVQMEFYIRVYLNSRIVFDKVSHLDALLIESFDNYPEILEKCFYYNKNIVDNLHLL